MCQALTGHMPKASNVSSNDHAAQACDPFGVEQNIAILPSINVKSLRDLNKFLHLHPFSFLLLTFYPSALHSIITANKVESLAPMKLP
jgi:hypothetical protein